MKWNTHVVAGKPPYRLNLGLEWHQPDYTFCVHQSTGAMTRRPMVVSDSKLDTRQMEVKNHEDNFRQNRYRYEL